MLIFRRGNHLERGLPVVSKLGSCQIDLDYTLAGDDRIEKVCPVWTRVARDRMGVRLEDELVIGRPLWDFINGGATLRLYDGLIWHTRKTGQRLSFRYRGDCPGAIRYMRMNITPGYGRRVNLRSELLYEQPTHREVYFSHVTYRRCPSLVQCCVCNKLEHNGRWYTLGEIADYTSLLDSLLPIEIGDTVCDSCQTKLEREVGVRL